MSSRQRARRMVSLVGAPSQARPDESDIPTFSVAGPVSRWQGIWRLSFISVWLGYLIPTLQEVWGAPSLGWRIVGFVAIVAFAMVYVAVFISIRRIRVGMLTDPRRGLSWAVLGIELALILAVLPSAGESTLAMMIYLAVLVMFLLPVWQAIALVLLTSATVATVPHFVTGWKPVNQLAFQILITAFAIWGIIQMLQRNNQLAQAREEITSLAVSQERLRFSRDLHDILGHTLTVITLKAELAGRLVQTDPDRAEHEIAEVERLARGALVDVRSTVAGYRDVGLATQLASARTALDAAGIEADLAGTVDDVPADRLELFGWAVREGVTNVVRHSGAGRCRVSVDRQQVEIADDGRGPGRCPGPDDPIGDSGDPIADPDWHTAGNGLSGLRERAEAVGASLTVGRSPEGGFLLRVAHSSLAGRR